MCKTGLVEPYLFDKTHTPRSLLSNMLPTKMNCFRRISVKIIFLVCILLQFQAYQGEEITERQCLDNNLFPDDESAEGTFNSFATDLEYYTGLGQELYTVTLSCESKPCIVNPNGTAIWEARMHLYMNNMMSNNDDARTTLDGCLCFSEDSVDFQNCMDEVRQNMIDQLEKVLIPKFKEIIESDCTTYEQNCL